MGDLAWVYLHLSLSGGLERLQAHHDPEMDKEEKMEGWMNCEEQSDACKCVPKTVDSLMNVKKY